MSEPVKAARRGVWTPWASVVCMECDYQSLLRTPNRGYEKHFDAVSKCFKNRNLHLEFKNLELVKELNLLAAGERVLGADVE